MQKLGQYITAKSVAFFLLAVFVIVTSVALLRSCKNKPADPLAGVQTAEQKRKADSVLTAKKKNYEDLQKQKAAIDSNTNSLSDRQADSVLSNRLHSLEMESKHLPAATKSNDRKKVN